MRSPALDLMFFTLDTRKSRYYDGITQFLQALARGDLRSRYDGRRYPYRYFLGANTLGFWTEEKEFKLIEALDALHSWPQPGSDEARAALVLWGEGQYQRSGLANGTASGRKAFVEAARDFIEDALA